MNFKEAIEWLKGERSMCNNVPQEPFETWQVRIAEADAAMVQQAYWVVKAYDELPSVHGGTCQGEVMSEYEYLNPTKELCIRIKSETIPCRHLAEAEKVMGEMAKGIEKNLANSEWAKSCWAELIQPLKYYKIYLTRYPKGE